VLGADTNYGDKDGTVDEAEWAKAFRAMGNFGGFAATRLGGQGDVAASHVRWRVKKSLPYLTAPILYNGVLFVVRDGGILTSYDPANGEVLKEGRLEGAIDKYYASPVAGDGKLYFASENGKVAVVKAAAQWDLLNANDLDAPLYATPALTDGRVLVRVRELLYCFGTL
jgi:outer membrane protein assembly factor BamB